MERRAPSPRRAANVENTEIVNKFLDKYFYTEDNGFYDFNRIDDRARQVAGVDVEFSFREEPYVADEKAASDYINKAYPLSTFSLELAFVNKANRIMDGWFIREDLDTDSYVFVWIDSAEMHNYEETNIRVINNEDSIKLADVALVRKSDIKGYLESLGWTSERLREKCERIIKCGGDGENMGNVWHNGCKFSYSKNLVEKPVNVLVPRKKLIEMAVISRHYGF
jgi:hypothetical protein